MNQRPSGLPSPEQVTGLLEAEFGRAGYEIEAVTVDGHARPPRIRVIADGEVPPDLDTVAALSRSASALLDTLDADAPAGTAYVLEVSSPGVERPLTSEKHFRRARGRKVVVELVDGTTTTGRIAAVSDGEAELVVREGRAWTTRRLPLTDVRKAVVQVEFSPPSAEELALAATESKS